MKNINAAAVVHEIREIFFHRLRPFGAATDAVAGLNDDIAAGKFRTPCFPIGGIGSLGRGDDSDLEQARRFEHAPDECRRLLPVVVTETVENEHADFFISGGRGKNTGKQQREKNTTAHGGEIIFSRAPLR